jgi:hypothetical protein
MRGEINLKTEENTHSEEELNLGMNNLNPQHFPNLNRRELENDCAKSSKVTREKKEDTLTNMR